MLRLRGTGSIVVALASLLATAGLAAETASPESSERALAEAVPELRAHCEEMRHGSNGYFSDRLLRQLEGRLEPPDPGAATADFDAVSTRGLHGRELLKLGRVDEAVRELELAWEQSQRLDSGDERSGSLRSSVHWHLALAHLSLAEDQNCVGHRTAASCILPIGPDAVHPLPEHSRRAGDLFLEYAREHPRNVQAVWLLNLARRVSGDYPNGVPEPLRIPDARLSGDTEHSFPAWTDRAPELGLHVSDLAGGAVMDDFDGDGLLDLVSSTWDPCDGMKAWRNDGSGGFEEVTDAWGLRGQLGGLNLVHADYDGDGDLDLLLLRGAWLLSDGEIRHSLLRNEAGSDGGIRFRDVSEAAGIASPPAPSQTAAFADYDGDGDLDLFVGNEATQGHPYPSQLWRNRGDGTFEDVAESAGVTNLRYAKGVTWGDYDGDGDPDLFVSNFGENRLYRNEGPDDRGRVRFIDLAPALGITAPVRESFATWFFDYDQDGDLDLFVGDYRSQAAQVTASYLGLEFDEGQPLLYRNQLQETGEEGFVEVSRSSGIRRPAMPMGANYGDLDNDGWLDVYLGTGEPDLASLMPNVMYRNIEGRFVDVTFDGGFGRLQKGHGVALGDLDNDGDQDLFHQLGGFYPGDDFANALFENPLLGVDRRSDPEARWLQLRLRGADANRFALGATIEIEVERLDGSLRTIHQPVSAGGSFGASSLRQEVGLGDARRIRSLTVHWPWRRAGTGGGLLPASKSRFENVELDRIYVVRQPARAGDTDSPSGPLLEALPESKVPRFELGARPSTTAEEHVHP